MTSLPLSVSRTKFPLLGVLTKQQAGFIACERLFSLETDRYLAHHRFNSVPFLPGVIGLELFAELARYALPEKVVTDFIDVEFQSAVRFKDDQPCLLNASLLYTSTKGTACLEQPTPKGPRLCFQAEVLFASHKDVPPLRSLPAINKEPFLPKKFIYQLLPHGPLFQPLAEINQLDETRVLALEDYSHRRLFSWRTAPLILSPLTIEAAFQAIGLLDFVATGKAGLPSRIGRLTFYETSGNPYVIIGEKSAEQTFNFTVLTKKGEVVLQATDYQIAETKMGDTLSALERIRSHAVRRQFIIPKRSWLEVVSLRLLKDKLSRDPKFLESFLQPAERASLEEMPEEEQFYAIAERYALKRALRVVLFKSSMLEFEIRTTPDNKQLCQYKGKTIHLATKKLEGYVLALASYHKPYEITAQKEGG